MKKHNFSAGPAILPASVMEQASKAALDFNGIGLSILEISHRSPEFSAVLDEAEILVRDIANLSDDYAVLFLQGGASSQFFMTAMNLLDDNEMAAYADTGSWSAKAIKEARNFGKVEVVASSKEQNYTFIPKGYEVPANAKYFHLTSNNTIFGTQYHSFPETKVPLVADMSSDIFSRPIDIERFGLIYAGAQKNIGPAGLTLVIVRKDALGKVNRTIPTMLDYRTHVSKKSTFNTPPVFAIYVAMLTFRWIKAGGGLEAMARKNAAKAQLIYKEIDDNPLFTGTVTSKEDRSQMNATFVMAPGKEELQATFLDMCKEAGCVGVKGHRSVGGFRASMYNAMDIESVQVLVDVMKAFSERYG
ncbi:MAG: 3-phosphoserine/phosphohydroxythreonine transaminase [Lewinellaceae bacterium]|nr:3-phosphoserine/phosphohydroxythreonine transaminase [Lewinellaceae bacterium]MCB9291010.1 3-phosphoserine/phosphohydroxythreonine transaminase [Lewinellaceae bacterium]